MTTATQPKSRPIIFTGESVREIISGRKSQSRRVVKLDADGCYDTVTDTGMARHPHSAASIMRDVKCPYGVAGDLLWVKEKWINTIPAMSMQRGRVSRRWLKFAADGVETESRWGSPLFMPRWASRLTLEILSVTVERVQDISETDAIAEGIQNVQKIDDGKWFTSNGMDRFYTAKAAFAERWDLINGKRPGCDWASNPFVWRIEFRKVEP